MMWFTIHTVRLGITTIDQHRRDIITIITTDRRHRRDTMGHLITIIMGHLIMGHLTSIAHLLTEDTDKKSNEI